jgi:flagellin
MPQFINTNIMSLNTVRVLDQSQKSLQTSMERLSSGKRINHARDDAAGMAITEKMTSQIRGMNQAVRNSNDGISMVQTADGAMEGIASKLQRMRELAVQAANGIYSTSDRNSLNIEFQALDDEINRVATTTQFNGINLLASNLTTEIQTGALSGSTIDVELTGVTSSNLGISTDLISSQSSASTSIGAIDAALSIVNSARAKLGATQNRLETTVQDLKNNVENLSASRSRIKDADFASETATLAKNQILQQAGMAMLSQANQLPQQVLKLLQ